MVNQYRNVNSVHDLDNGQTLRDLDIELSKAIDKLMKLGAKYRSRAVKKKVTVRAIFDVILVEYPEKHEEDRMDPLYVITPRVESSNLYAPVVPVMARENIGPDGTRELCVRAGGGEYNDPREGVLCTPDGHVVDHDTGDLIDVDSGIVKPAAERQML